MCRWMSPLMVGPNVFSWSEPTSEGSRHQHTKGNEKVISRRYLAAQAPQGTASETARSVAGIDSPIQIKYLDPCEGRGRRTRGRGENETFQQNWYRSQECGSEKGTHQYGDWMHVESAAPMPVPVQIRIPRLYKVEVLDTPANCSYASPQSLSQTPCAAMIMRRRYLPSVHASRGSEEGHSRGCV